MSKIKVFFIIIIILVLIVLLDLTINNLLNVVHAETGTKIITKGFSMIRGKLNGIEIRNYYFEYYNLTEKTFDHLCKISHMNGLIKVPHTYIFKENAEKIINLNIYNVLTHGVPGMNRSRYNEFFNLVSYKDYLSNFNPQHLGNSIEMENKYMIPVKIRDPEEIANYIDKHYNKINEIFDNQGKPINLFDLILKNSYDYLQYKNPDYYCKNQDDFLKNFSNILKESLKDKQPDKEKQ